MFVGGSLVDHGGHNILEPAIFGKPIVFGPHMQNFREIADAFLSNDAAVQVQSERELEEALLALVTDPVRRARLGAAARALVEANRGAKTRRSQVIARAAAAGDDGARPGPRGASVPSVWCIDRDARARCTARRRPGGGLVRAAIRAPAAARIARSISVGNLRVGGSGKTPIVEYIARLLAASRASGRRS